jgi:hypothetical protein
MRGIMVEHHNIDASETLFGSLAGLVTVSAATALTNIVFHIGENLD